MKEYFNLCSKAGIIHNNVIPSFDDVPMIAGLRIG
jgi:hypothetical protein